MNVLNILKQFIPLLITGLKTTISMSIISIFLGMIIGAIVCLIRLLGIKGLKFIVACYVWIIRGTPMIVQALFIFFGLNQLLSIVFVGFRLSVYHASILTLSLNSGAYFSEIFRAAFNSIPVGQLEAAKSLGVNKITVGKRIVIPQMFHYCLPPIVSQCIMAVKDTSVLSFIGLKEITNMSRVYVGSTYKFFEIYILLGFSYLILLSGLMILADCLEKKLDYGKSN